MDLKYKIMVDFYFCCYKTYYIQNQERTPWTGLKEIRIAQSKRAQKRKLTTFKAIKASHRAQQSTVSHLQNGWQKEKCETFWRDTIVTVLWSIPHVLRIPAHELDLSFFLPPLSPTSVSYSDIVPFSFYFQHSLPLLQYFLWPWTFHLCDLKYYHSQCKLLSY